MSTENVSVKGWQDQLVHEAVLNPCLSKLGEPTFFGTL